MHNERDGLTPGHDASFLKNAVEEKDTPLADVARSMCLLASPVVFSQGLNSESAVTPLSAECCQKCRGAGYLRANVPFGHPLFGKPIKCQCIQEQERTKQRQAFLDLSLLGHMKYFEQASFSSFKKRLPGVKEAYNASLNFAERPEGWLTLVGPNGCGKTHLAVAIARTCLERGMSVFFSVVPDLLDHLRATLSIGTEEHYDQLFQKMKDVEILFLDDLGAEYGTSWASEKLFQLINYRYNLALPMVVTTNSSAFRLINSRISSRLMSGFMVDMTGSTDYRRYKEPKHCMK